MVQVNRRSIAVLTTMVLLLMICIIILGNATASAEPSKTDTKVKVSTLVEHTTDVRDWMETGNKTGIARKIAKRDAAHGCLGDEYWSEDHRRCKMCTHCSPGTQHDPPQACGYGRGFELHCTPCPDGSYQDKEDFLILRCKTCVICDTLAVTVQSCTSRTNTVCGPCPEGWFYSLPNVCIKCSENDTSVQGCQSVLDPDRGADLVPTHVDVESGAGTTNEDPITKPSTHSLAPLDQTSPAAEGKHIVAFHEMTFIVIFCTAFGLVSIIVVAWCCRKHLRRQNAQKEEYEHVELDDLNGKPDSFVATCSGVHSLNMVHPSSQPSASTLSGFRSDYSTRLIDSWHSGVLPANTDPDSRDDVPSVAVDQNNHSGGHSAADSRSEGTSDQSSGHPGHRSSASGYPRHSQESGQVRPDNNYVHCMSDPTMEEPSDGFLSCPQGLRSDNFSATSRADPASHHQSARQASTAHGNNDTRADHSYLSDIEPLKSNPPY